MRNRKPQSFAKRPESNSLQPLFTLDEVAPKTKRSRASIYRDIAAKRLNTVKLGGSTRITADAYAKYAGISA
jgi:hypothetical protein